jgi:4-hydroxythreonine-4-phosphate dehydrogenase
LPDGSGKAGRLAADAVIWAARAALRGEVAAVVTAPLHKEALAAAGVDFPGHTELLQHEAARHLGRSTDELPVRMMLVSPQLRTVLVSIHVSLRQALDLVTVERVLTTVEVAHASLLPHLGRPPRLAVAGLNPHAGEGGLKFRSGCITGVFITAAFISIWSRKLGASAELMLILIVRF